MTANDNDISTSLFQSGQLQSVNNIQSNDQITPWAALEIKED